MNLTKYVLPYPVLGINGDFISTDAVTSSLDMQITETYYRFTVTFQIQNKTILNLVKKGFAKFSCEADCSRTYYREAFESDKNQFSFQIKRTSLVGDVSLFFSIVAVQPIQDYTNPNFNPKFYENYKFNLQKGQLLAFFGQATFKADIKYEELRAVGSIIEVTNKPTTNFMYFDFENDKIRIILPEEEYKNFNAHNNTQTADIIHASIVQSALISALHSFKQHKECTWAEILKLRVSNDKKLQKFSDLDNLDSFQICELVNLILDNSNKRMFENITKLLDN